MPSIVCLFVCLLWVFVFFFWLRRTAYPDRGLNPGHSSESTEILTTRPPGNSPKYCPKPLSYLTSRNPCNYHIMRKLRHCVILLSKCNCGVRHHMAMKLQSSTGILKVWRVTTKFQLPPHRAVLCTPCKIFSTILGLHPLDASSTSSTIMTIKNVSREYCRMFPREQNCPL